MRFIEDIQREVALERGITVDAMLCRRGTKTVAQARMDAMARCLRETDHSVAEIAKAFKKDRSSVFYVKRRMR